MLRKTDRCDRCPAEAHVRLHKSHSELLFCNHHHREHRMPLFAAGWEVTETKPDGAKDSE